MLAKKKAILKTKIHTEVAQETKGKKEEKKETDGSVDQIVGEKGKGR